MLMSVKNRTFVKGQLRTSMSDNSGKRKAAKEFVKEWIGKGYEKGETQRFWLSLLHGVFGIDDPMKMMEFELPVKTITKEKGSDFIDAYIHSTKVLIEQKGSHVALSAKARQSDGAELTPYQQGRRYAAGLPLSMAPRWIVACNFTTFEVHDMEHPNDAPEVIQLADLEKEYNRLSFLVDDTNVHLKKELEVSIQAGEIVGVLYDKILAQYKDPSNPESQKALNKLCVRLVFCLYAEDSGIFGSKNMFHDYMEQFPASMFREQLIKLFRILNQKPEDRDPYEDDKLLAFPYVNGGMFAGEIEIPRITEEIRDLILQRASDDFDWSLISPTIFGAVFESTLNPETRRSGGMHYTSIENIHKVIDPLFLDDLKAEMADIKATSVAKTKKDRAYAFQDKISKLKFFDPACGSGNFLTESYTSLRRLENEALRIIYGGDRVIGEMADPIKVSINQFYGIEINDFACSVAQTALWIAEAQMMQETDEIVGFNLDPLPLKTYTNIHEGNALRMDWNEVVPASELNYIMGNPPFSAGRRMGNLQREDMNHVMAEFPNNGDLDYVTAWYAMAARYMQGTTICTGFVSTSSISQGDQVINLWKPLFEKYNLNIFHAVRPFNWQSESQNSASVHCVIIEFTINDIRPLKTIAVNATTIISVKHINGYLIDAPDSWIEGVTKPLCNVPVISNGNKPLDNAICAFTPEEKDAFIKNEPLSAPFFMRYMGSREFINNIERWFLIINRIPPHLLARMPMVQEKLRLIREYRLSSNSAQTKKLAEYPAKFHFENMPEKKFLVIPQTSSGRRRYVPIGFLTPDIMTNNKLQVMKEGSLYEFGILSSSVHNSWLRAVAGRLRDDFTYSVSVVYNTFPWPEPSETQRTVIEETAKVILDTRNNYSESSLAYLYDDLLMPEALRKAHHVNDVAVLKAYGFPKDATESDIVARLFKMYQKLSQK